MEKKRQLGNQYKRKDINEQSNSKVLTRDGKERQIGKMTQERRHMNNKQGLYRKRRLKGGIMKRIKKISYRINRYYKMKRLKKRRKNKQKEDCKLFYGSKKRSNTSLIVAISNNIKK